MTGVVALFFEVAAIAGAGVVVGLMVFGFSNLWLAIAAGSITVLVMAPFAFFALRDYTVLLASLTAYGVSAITCLAISLGSNESFNFSVLAQRVTSFHTDEHEASAAKEPKQQLVPNVYSPSSDKHFGVQMKTLLTTYILIWPVISAGILVLLLVSLFRDVKTARKTGDSLV